MKKNFLLLAMLAFVMFSCGSLDSKESKDESDDSAKFNTDTAIEYNDDMVAIQADVDQALVDLLDAIDTYDEMTMLDSKDEALNIIDQAYEDVEDAGGFDGSNDFQDALYDLIDMYQGIINNEILEIIDYSIVFDDLSDEEFDYYLELYDVALNKYEESFDEFTDFQMEFSDEWDFDLE